MEKENGKADPQNGENIIVEDTKVEENDDVDVLKQKFEKVSSSNRQLYERAKKAEVEAKELREFKAKAEVDLKSGKPEKPIESNEPDYGKLAYLHSQGINHTEDIKAVNLEAERLK